MLDPGEGNACAGFDGAGATDARVLVKECVFDAPCSPSVDGETSGRFDNDGWFLDDRSSDGGFPCALKGRFRIEAACAMPLGNTVSTLELPRAGIPRLRWYDR